VGGNEHGYPPYNFPGDDNFPGGEVLKNKRSKKTRFPVGGGEWTWAVDGQGGEGRASEGHDGDRVRRRRPAGHPGHGHRLRCRPLFLKAPGPTGIFSAPKYSQPKANKRLSKKGRG